MTLETSIKDSVREAYKQIQEEIRKDIEENIIPIKNFRYYEIRMGTLSVQYFIDKARGE